MNNKLFPKADSLMLSNEQIDVLVNIMTTKSSSGGKVSEIHAGYTYFGQMIAHDIVRSTNKEKPRKLSNACLMLESIYGDKTFNDSFTIFDEDDKFLFSQPIGSDFKNYFNMDLLRKDGEVVIPDKRNDENYLISQLHLFWQKFHNIIPENQLFKEYCKGRELENDGPFELAREMVIRTFQQITIEDYLYNILDIDIYKAYMKKLNTDGSLFFYENSDDFKEVPLEFSHAAFRFGHSMVKSFYKVNGRNIKPLSLFELFNPYHKPIHTNQIIDWNRFFGDIHEKENFEFADIINDTIVNPMNNIFDEINPIVRINLSACNNASLASGTQLLNYLRKYHKQEVKELKLDDKEFDIDFAKREFKEYRDKNISLDQIPLWLYILLESSYQNNNQRLGKLGSMIVAEVVLHSIKSAKISVLRSENRNEYSNKIITRINTNLFECAESPKKLYESLLGDFRRAKMLDLMNIVLKYKE